MSENGLAGRYATAMRSYLAGSGESALQNAYEVGRAAMEAGLGPLAVFSIHRDVVAGLALAPVEDDELATQVSAVLIETLAPFEMAYASLDTARVAVHELRATVLREASDLAQLRRLARSGETTAAADRMAALLELRAGQVEAIRERLESAAQTISARKSLIADVIHAQEEERRRIAGEIHDDAVQVMAAVALRLSLLRRNVGDGPAAESIEQLESAVGESIASLRRLIAGLSPAELERSGLAAAIRSELEQTREDLGLEFRLVDDTRREPGATARGTSFRIFREAMANVRKHASARLVDVHLGNTDGGVITRVSDDGVGFELSNGLDPHTGHIGLTAMRERADLAGGWLHVASGAAGTTIEFWIPDAPGK